MLSAGCTTIKRQIRFVNVSTSSTTSGTDPQSEAILALVAELVGHETPSYDAAASARIAESLSARFESLGAVVERIPSPAGIDLVADFPGTGAPLLLVGHTDTVWPVGTLDGDVPLSRDGDVVRGPGTYDMKAGIVVMLEALRRTKDLPPAERRAVRIVLVCDEEVGSPLSSPLLLERAEGVAGAIGFESPHPDGALKVGRRGSTRVRLSVEGKAAHAALDPEDGVSAIEELVDQLVRVRAITSDPALPGPVLCNVGTISGGTRANVVPAHAEAEVGLRFTDAATERQVLEALTALSPIRARARLAVDVLSSRPAWQPSPADALLLEQISVAGRAVGQQVSGRPAAGAGDTNLLGSRGIPTVDGFGPRGGGAHARDEHFLVSSLIERVELLCAVLRVSTP
ncbi:glutamate carboxypeptidase [Microbacterium sp. W4I20]|nr:glutamate carboxypeptidase [Microbacterium sp. W4I20]